MEDKYKEERKKVRGKEAEAEQNTKIQHNTTQARWEERKTI